MQHHWKWRAGHWFKDKSSTGLRIIVTKHIANVETVAISTESITEVNTAMYGVHQVRRFTIAVTKVAERSTQARLVQTELNPDDQISIPRHK